MVRIIIIWTAGIYLLLKICQLLTRRSAGYRQTEADIGTRKRLGEPLLLGFSLILATTIVVYSNWWTHRLAEREYVHAKGCYTQLETSIRLRAVARKYGNNILYLERQSSLYLGTAEQHGAMLGWDMRFIHDDLRQEKAASLAYYTEAAPKKDLQKLTALINDIDRCLKDEWASHGEIFNP